MRRILVPLLASYCMINLSPPRDKNACVRSVEGVDRTILSLLFTERLMHRQAACGRRTPSHINPCPQDIFCHLKGVSV